MIRSQEKRGRRPPGLGESAHQPSNFLDPDLLPGDAQLSVGLRPNRAPQQLTVAARVDLLSPVIR